MKNAQFTAEDLSCWYFQSSEKTHEAAFARIVNEVADQSGAIILHAEWSDVDQCYVAHCSKYMSIKAHGPTFLTALANIAKVLADVLEDEAEHDDQVTKGQIEAMCMPADED